jgi:HK97 family phage major capsid protein
LKIIDDATITAYLRGEKIPQLRAIQSQGGTLLPLSLAKKIHSTPAPGFPLQRLVSRETVSGLKVKVPYQKSGVVLNWLDEGQGQNNTDAELCGFTANLHKVTATVKISEEVLQDSLFDIENFLVEVFGEGLAPEMEAVFAYGTGNGKPRGFLLDCQGHNAAGNKITYADLLGLFNSLDVKYFNSACWIFNKPALADIMLITDNSGNTVFKQYETKEAGDPAGFLYSRPCYVSLLPDKNPVAFGDFSYYKVIEQLPLVQRLGEIYSGNGIVGFVLKSFLDGKLLKPEAVTALNLGD